MPAAKQTKPDFKPVFAALRDVLASQASRLSVKTDKPTQYTLLTRSPSLFPQHKGQPMWFGEVRIGKAYVSLHLLALYFNPELNATISPELKKRKQGKACFNFKTMPERELLAELRRLAKAGVKAFAERKWL